MLPAFAANAARIAATRIVIVSLWCSVSVTLGKGATMGRAYARPAAVSVPAGTLVV
jgi:hypothetical protein